jgi:hypothetical protein
VRKLSTLVTIRIKVIAIVAFASATLMSLQIPSYRLNSEREQSFIDSIYTEVYQWAVSDSLTSSANDGDGSVILTRNQRVAFKGFLKNRQPYTGVFCKYTENSDTVLCCVQKLRSGKLIEEVVPPGFQSSACRAQPLTGFRYEYSFYFSMKCNYNPSPNHKNQVVNDGDYLTFNNERPNTNGYHYNGKLYCGIKYLYTADSVLASILLYREGVLIDTLAIRSAN